MGVDSTPSQEPAPHHVFHPTDGQLDGIAAAPVGEHATRLIRELGERQHGVVARRQLTAVGLGKGLVQERLRTGLLMPVHRGVYAVGHRRFDLRHRWMAAVLACGPGAVLSHRSAAQLWELRGYRGPVEVTRASGGTPRKGLRVFQYSLPSAAATSADGIPVTTLEWTLLQIAGRLDLRQLERAVVAADRTGRLSWPLLRKVLQVGAGHIGIERLRSVVRDADPNEVEARSGIEVDFLGLCRLAGLPAPSVNVLVGGHLVDFLWPKQRVIVEVDSYRYHADPLAFERDHRNTVALEAAGYEVHRITEAMLASDPDPFFALVEGSLRSRTA